MSRIHEFIDEQRTDGEVDSEGIFTIDRERAREKLARFALPHPEEFILKFIQAANLSADSAELHKNGSKISLCLEGWDPKLSLAELVAQLTTLESRKNEDGLTYLVTGLITLSEHVLDGVELVCRSVGSQETEVLKFGHQIDHTVSQGEPSSRSTLTISWPQKTPFKVDSLVDLMKKRCLFSRIPILVDGEPLGSIFPETSGKFRPLSLVDQRTPYFNSNRTLVSSFQAPEGVSFPLLLSKPQVRSAQDKSERSLYLELTVDLDPRARIWLTKAGVMAEEKRLDIGVPGLVGIASADLVPTDLTGTQFIEGPALNQIWQETTERSADLIDTALVDLESLKVDNLESTLSGVPPSMSNYLNKIVTSLIVCAFLSFFISVNLSVTNNSAPSILPFLVLTPLIVGVTVYLEHQRQQQYGERVINTKNSEIRRHLGLIYEEAKYKIQNSIQRPGNGPTS